MPRNLNYVVAHIRDGAFHRLGVSIEDPDLLASLGHDHADLRSD